MNWDLTNFIVATWGAVLATALGVVEVVKHLERRRGKIRVIVRDFSCRDANDQPVSGAELVCFEAVNDAEKPVNMTGLVLNVGEHQIDLTGYSGTPNLTVISEGEDFSRHVERWKLLNTTALLAPHQLSYLLAQQRVTSNV